MGHGMWAAFGGGKGKETDSLPEPREKQPHLDLDFILVRETHVR